MSSLEQPERAERRRAFARRFTPARMQRIAVVTQADSLRDALVAVAGSGSVELDDPADSQAHRARQHGRCSGWGRTPSRRAAERR